MLQIVTYFQDYEMQFLHLLQDLHNPVLDVIMLFFTRLGDVGLIWILTAIVLLCMPKHRFCGIRLTIVLILCTIIGCVGLKNIVGRPRPCWLEPDVLMLIKVPKDFSFPSGHTMSSFGCAHVLFNYNKKWGAIAIAVATMIAFSRMYLFVHFPTDILGGFIIGMVCSYLTNMLILKYYESKHGKRT